MAIIIYLPTHVKLSLNWSVMIPVIHNIYDLRTFSIISQDKTCLLRWYLNIIPRCLKLKEIKFSPLVGHELL